jgi:hypothetical protein
LHHRTLRIAPAIRAVGYRYGVVDVAEEVVDIKMPNGSHVVEAAKRISADLSEHWLVEPSE